MKDNQFKKAEALRRVDGIDEVKNTIKRSLVPSIDYFTKHFSEDKYLESFSRG